MTPRAKLDRAEVCALVLYVVFAVGCAFAAGLALGAQAALRVGVACDEPDVLAVRDTPRGVVVQCGAVDSSPNLP